MRCGYPYDEAYGISEITKQLSTVISLFVLSGYCGDVVFISAYFRVLSWTTVVIVNKGAQHWFMPRRAAVAALQALSSSEIAHTHCLPASQRYENVDAP